MNVSQKSGKRTSGVTEAGMARMPCLMWGVRGRKKLLYRPGIQVGFSEEW